jgi:4a-hydroxytetrahydrobiopterin dehydratase
VETVSLQEIKAAELLDWRKLSQALHARFGVKDLGQAAELVDQVSRLETRSEQLLEFSIPTGAVEVKVCTRRDGLWVTAPDLDLAVAISAIARDMGLEAQPDQLLQIEFALDVDDEDAILDFWSVAVAGSTAARVHDAVFDPAGHEPALRVQPPERLGRGQRWHMDIWVAPELADARIAALVRAGGTVVHDGDAPFWTTVADPEGNRVCISSRRGPGPYARRSADQSAAAVRSSAEPASHAAVTPRKRGQLPMPDELLRAVAVVYGERR